MVGWTVDSITTSSSSRTIGDRKGTSESLRCRMSSALPAAELFDVATSFDSFLKIIIVMLRRFISSASAAVSSAFSSITMSGSNNYPLILSQRPATCSLVPPGQCQFNPTFQAVPLLDRIPCDTGSSSSSSSASSPSSYVLRFGLPDPTKPMDLTTCACLLASVQLMDNTKGEMVDVIRPYTPISTNDQVGCFDLLIKDYGEHGWLSKYMCEDLPIGGTVSILLLWLLMFSLTYYQLQFQQRTLTYCVLS